jgi:hypothetical protein
MLGYTGLSPKICFKVLGYVLILRIEREPECMQITLDIVVLGASDSLA